MGKSGGSSKKAIYALKKAQERVIAAQKEGYDYAQNALSPYTGLTKYNPLFEYMSTGIATPEANAMMQGQDLNAFITNNPAYQYQLGESEKGINRAASARGMWNSSAAMNQLGDNSRALAASNWNDYYNRLGGLYTTGANANNALAGYGMQLGGNQASTYNSMGQAIANQYALNDQQKAAAKNATIKGAIQLGGMALGGMGGAGMFGGTPLGGGSAFQGAMFGSGLMPYSPK